MPKRVVKIRRAPERYESKAYRAYARAYASAFLGVLMANSLLMASSRRGFMRRVLDHIEGKPPYVAPPPPPPTEVPPRREYDRRVLNYPIPPDWPANIFEGIGLRR